MTQDISGVCLVAWTGFLTGSFFWLFYGIIHREKPIVVINGSLITPYRGLSLSASSGTPA